MTTLNPGLDTIPPSIFTELDRRLAACGEPRIMPLHQGKTTFAPAVDVRLWDTSEFPILPHEHASPSGVASLRARAAAHHTGRFDRAVSEEDVIITAGATHAIATILGAIVRQSDEVLILSPQWLFAAGLVAAAGGVPVEVPVFVELSRDAQFDFIASIRRAATSRTVAIYFNTPNNPTGYSLTTEQMQALADVSRELDLWLIADNAYEAYEFDGRRFIDVSALPRAMERTFSIHTFSKTFAMPGLRIAYAIVPDAAAATVRKRVLYSVYSIATISQFAAAQALDVYDDVACKHNRAAEEARNVVARNLVVPHTRMSGGLYSFLDLRQWQGGPADEFIDRCLTRGVSLAAGRAFGRMFDGYARLCFTAVGLEELGVAIDRVNAVYGED
jgi:aspartate aminotransferase